MSKLIRVGLRSTVRIMAVAAACLLAVDQLQAQRIRIPDSQYPYTPPPASTFPQLTPGTTIQQPNFAPANPAIVSPPLMQLPPITSPQATFPSPGFDAYGGVSPSLPGTTWSPATTGSGAMIYPPANAYPWIGPDAGASPAPPPVFAPANNSPSIYGPTYGSPNPYPGIQSPSGAWPNSPGAWPNQAWSRFRSEFLPRLVEHPRFRHTYLYGEDGDDLQIHDVELATTLTFPGLLMTRQPWRVSPGFIFHFWDGPDTAVTGVDLPAQAYSAFLAFDFISALNQPLGAELNFTVGMYTDFDHVTTDSLRLTGVGLGWIRLDNTTTFKLGVEYLDRLDIKLLPAVGVFMMPSADLKLDLYFPRPKIARRVPNNLNLELWGYVGGEYGGGSWTIERMGGMGDQVDINDVRVFIGNEWLGRRGVTGFMELGYVFKRELFYKSIGTPVDLSDTFMVRSGLSF